MKSLKDHITKKYDSKNIEYMKICQIKSKIRSNINVAPKGFDKIKKTTTKNGVETTMKYIEMKV